MLRLDLTVRFVPRTVGAFEMGVVSFSEAFVCEETPLLYRMPRDHNEYCEPCRFNLIQCIVCVASVEGVDRDMVNRIDLGEIGSRRRGVSSRHAAEVAASRSSSSIASYESDYESVTVTDMPVVEPMYRGTFFSALADALLRDMTSGLRHVGVEPFDCAVSFMPDGSALEDLIASTTQDTDHVSHLPSRSLWRRMQDTRALADLLAHASNFVFVARIRDGAQPRQRDVVMMSLRAMLLSPRTLRRTARLVHDRMTSHRRQPDLPPLKVAPYSVMWGGDMPLRVHAAVEALPFTYAATWQLRLDEVAEEASCTSSCSSENGGYETADEEVDVGAENASHRTGRPQGDQLGARRPPLRDATPMYVDSQLPPPPKAFARASVADVAPAPKPTGLGDAGAPVPVSYRIEYEGTVSRSASAEAMAEKFFGSHQRRRRPTAVPSYFTPTKSLPALQTE